MGTEDNDREHPEQPVAEVSVVYSEYTPHNEETALGEPFAFTQIIRMEVTGQDQLDLDSGTFGRGPLILKAQGNGSREEPSGLLTLSQWCPEKVKWGEFVSIPLDDRLGSTQAESEEEAADEIRQVTLVNAVEEALNIFAYAHGLEGFVGLDEEEDGGEGTDDDDDESADEEDEEGGEGDDE